MRARASALKSSESVPAEDCARWRTSPGPPSRGVLRAAGATYKYDLSLPVGEMYELVEATRARVAGLPMPCRVLGYGHLGDGNLHLNVSTARYDSAVLARLEPWVYEWTAARRGSISAEHGLGRMKAECIGCAAAPRFTCSSVL